MANFLKFFFIISFHYVLFFVLINHCYPSVKKDNENLTLDLFIDYLFIVYFRFSEPTRIQNSLIHLCCTHRTQVAPPSFLVVSTTGTKNCLCMYKTHFRWKPFIKTCCISLSARPVVSKLIMVYINKNFNSPVIL